MLNLFLFASAWLLGKRKSSEVEEIVLMETEGSVAIQEPGQLESQHPSWMVSAGGDSDKSKFEPQARASRASNASQSSSMSDKHRDRDRLSITSSTI